MIEVLANDFDFDASLADFLEINHWQISETGDSADQSLTILDVW